MADIFISYSRDDRALVAPIAKLLEDQGLTVWWDPDLEPGQQWDAEIERELDTASCVLVAWSRNSIKSRWVIAEADTAHNSGKLIPFLIDRIEPPMQFRLIQAQDLTAWTGFHDDLAARSLLRAVNSLLKLEHKPTPTMSSKSKVAVFAAMLAFLLAGIVPAAAIYMEHGAEVLWRALNLRPHYFVFHLTFFPAAVYFLTKCMISAWFDQFTKRARTIFLVLSAIMGLGLVALDHDSNPTYFEIKPEVLAQNEDLRQHFFDPGSGLEQRRNYAKSLSTLSKKGRSWPTLTPYYLGSFIQFSYWVLLVVTLGLVSFSQSSTSYGAAVSVLYSGGLASTWLPLYAGFLTNKLMLYDTHTLTSAIYLGMTILLFLFVSAWIISKRYMKYNVHQYAIYVILAVSIMIFLFLILQEKTFIKVKFWVPEDPQPLLIAFPLFVLLFVHPIIASLFSRTGR